MEISVSYGLYIYYFYNLYTPEEIHIFYIYHNLYKIYYKLQIQTIVRNFDQIQRKIIIFK